MQNVDRASLPWWYEPYRIVQTNLRLTDAALDPIKLAREARNFGATAITFNVGGIFAFYPTELRLQATNPFITRDLTGDMLQALHAEGLRMVGRYDLSKGTAKAYHAHPEWFVHNKAGEPQEYNGTYQACVNGSWAGGYALEILRESLARYDLDGVFFNMTGYRPFDYSGTYHGICWCRNCRDGFAAMFQSTLPEREDFEDPAYRNYLTFQRRTSQAAAQRIYDTVKAVRPKTGVMGGGHGPCDFMRLELQRSIKRSAPEWPHQAGELTRWATAIGQGKPYAVASTNFLDYRWRYSSETSAHQMLRFGQALAGGAQLDYYLLGLFDQPNAEPIEPVHQFMVWHAANERNFVRTRSLAKVALYHSRATDTYGAATITGSQRTGCFRGAYRILLESRIPFDYVSDENIHKADAAERLSAYDVIVMSNVSCVSDAEAAALDAFVAAGGTLIATGETGLYDELGRPRQSFALESFPAHRLNLAASALETYVEIGAEELSFPRTRLLHLDGPYFFVEKKKDAESLLKLLPPPKYGPPELCFSEVSPDENPGFLVRRSGRGRAIYLPWLPDWLYFRDGLPEHRELLAQLINSASQSPVKLIGAGPVEVAIRAKDNGTGDRVVHIVNYAGQRHSAYEEPPAISGLRLGVQGCTGSANALVAGKAIKAGNTDPAGYLWLEIPPVKHFEVIVIASGQAGKDK